MSGTGERPEASGTTNTTPSTGIRDDRAGERDSRSHETRDTRPTHRAPRLARATRDWIDLPEDDERTPAADPSAGAAPDSRTEAGGSAGVATPDPAPPRRFRWGVPGFVVDGPPVLRARTPTDAARALVATLRARGALEPRRRQLSIALYELGGEGRAVPRDDLDGAADDPIIARIGAVVALAHRATPIVPGRGAR